MVPPETEKTCPITLEVIDHTDVEKNVACTGCGNLFIREAFDRWLAQKGTCPLCRMTICEPAPSSNDSEEDYFFRGYDVTDFDNYDMYSDPGDFADDDDDMMRYMDDDPYASMTPSSMEDDEEGDDANVTSEREHGDGGATSGSRIEQASLAKMQATSLKPMIDPRQHQLLERLLYDRAMGRACRVQHATTSRVLSALDFRIVNCHTAMCHWLRGEPPVNEATSSLLVEVFDPERRVFFLGSSLHLV